MTLVIVLFLSEYTFLFLLLLLLVLFYKNVVGYNVIFSKRSFSTILLYYLFFKNFFWLNFFKYSNIIKYYSYGLRVLKWKPLFQKGSYFANYRANKNRWLNK